MLAAAVRDAGGDVVASPMTGDDVDTFRAALDGHAGDADLIITTGGVSAGAYEVVKDALGGEVEFVKVAMQPGMPQGAGRIGSTPIITLPGNPSAPSSRSRCSSAHRCVRPWGCPSRAAAAGGGADRGPDVAARQATVPSRRARRRQGLGHQLRTTGEPSSALAGVSELPIGNRRGDRRAGGGIPGAGVGPVKRVVSRRIAARWPDAPTSDQAPRDSWRWRKPPSLRCTPTGCRSSAPAWRLP